jgi:hypothetical protein
MWNNSTGGLRPPFTPKERNLMNMTETKNADKGLTFVKPETVKHGEVDGFGYCSWGQTSNGRWYSINYFPKHPMNRHGINAEMRWDIEARDYAAFGIES